VEGTLTGHGPAIERESHGTGGLDVDADDVHGEGGGGRWLRGTIESFGLEG
jgi:hypothetical protein